VHIFQHFLFSEDVPKIFPYSFATVSSSNLSAFFLTGSQKNRSWLKSFTFAYFSVLSYNKYRELFKHTFQTEQKLFRMS
jgi:hypothetical protein